MEAKVTVQCPKCGSGYILDGKNCRKCGHKGKREEFVKENDNI